MRPIVLLPLAAVAGREVLSFDFGWTHRTGLTHPALPDDRPPVNPDPGVAPPESGAKYDDSNWTSVVLPFDALIGTKPSEKACPTGCSGNSFIPRHVLWFRKTFKLPEAWRGEAIWLDFEGSFRLTTVWVNGVKVAYHDCGYTPFRIRLDNLTNINIGSGSNTLAVFVDPDNGDEGSREHGSGWWYEGGGLYRHVHLVHARPVHIEQDGLFAYSNVTLEVGALATHSRVIRDNAASAVVQASAAIVNVGGASAGTCVVFALTDANGTRLEASPVALEVPAGATATAHASIHVASARLWSSSTPHLYTVSAEVHEGACAGAALVEAAANAPWASAMARRATLLDATNVVHGFRSLRYDADEGFFLNEQHFKVRGFCDHNTFAVVGMAVPERINLFRAQASRAVGGNGRRTSHNPPDTAMLAIYDRIGIVVMDENRLFANESRYVTNMGALVKRDRNHPSVVIWSFCNEAGCEGSHETGGPRFYEIAYRYDGSRPTLANMFTFGDLLSRTIDVQGFSHQSRDHLEQCHAQLPHKPIYMSECCSCNTMRDEDEGCETKRDNPHNACIQKSFNARCTESNLATNASDGVPWAVGTMIWTLFDYYGEPPVGGAVGRGEVSGTYGQFDLCGFPKAAAFWYRTQWLLAIADNPDKTFPTADQQEVHLVESWEPPDAFPSTRGNKTRAMHAYSSAPHVELLVNGKSQGVRSLTRMVDGPGSYAEWEAVPWEAGSVTAIARDASGKEVARTSKQSNGKPSKLGLSLDAPHPDTGTGTALLLDGQDAALLRASILDEAGQTVHLATDNVTFRVVSGPGLVVGSHNGDPHCHEPNNAPWHSAYHGLVRGVVRVTSIAALPAKQRALMASVDEQGPLSKSAPTNALSTEPIVVEAAADGFESVRLTIPTSTDAGVAGVMAVAAAAAGKPVDFFAH